jgi:hypothetical protein
MVRKFLFSLLIFFILDEVKSQDKYFTLSLGSPKQLTSQHYISDWKEKFNIRASVVKQSSSKKSFIGGGINYSNFNFTWWGRDPFVTTKRNVFDISPYFIVGLMFKMKKIILSPQFDVGYTILVNNTSIADKRFKHGVYFAPGLNLNYQITERLFLGLSSYLDITSNNIDFDGSAWGVLTSDNIQLTSKTFKYYTLGINVGYNW